MVYLKVRDLIGTNLAVSTENGEKVYNEVEKSLNKGEEVTLDFEDINIIITAFLNAAIGSLFKNQKYSQQFLNKNVYLKNVDTSDNKLFEEVIQRAKEYFANKDFMDKNNRDTIYGKD